jgi:hypothetical protein
MTDISKNAELQQSCITAVNSSVLVDSKGLINGYLYKDYGIVMCQECVGAGIVKYKIVERDEKGDIKDVEQTDTNSKNLKLVM